MQQADNLSGFQHPMAASSSRSLLRLVWENRRGDPQYRRRIAKVITMSLLATPLRYNAAVEQIEITRPPIFIAATGTAARRTCIT